MPFNESEMRFAANKLLFYLIYLILIFCSRISYSQQGFNWIPPFPDRNNEANCGNCHKKIFDYWINSAHAKSANNQRVLDIYNGTAGEGLGLKNWGPGYKRDFPDSKGNCAFCHVPTAAVRLPYKIDLNRFATNSLFNENPEKEVNYISGIDTCGISCHFCHSIQESEYIATSHKPGVLSYTISKNRTNKNKRPCRQFVTNRIIRSKSLFCAPCHTIQFWNTPIYDTYLEWKNSKYKAKNIKCQDCHYRDKKGRFTHKLKGPQDNNFLKNAIELKYKVIKNNNKLEISISVSNAGAGHYFPTGSPLRNVVLVIMVKDSNGNQLDYQGDYILPDYAGQGNESNDFSGLPGKIYAKVIENNSQSYCEPIFKEMGLIGQNFAELKDKNLFAFWNPSHIEVDTRIPPNCTDASTFIFTIKPFQKEIFLNIQLIYRKVFKPLSRIKLWKTHDIIIYKINENYKL